MTRDEKLELERKYGRKPIEEINWAVSVTTDGYVYDSEYEYKIVTKIPVGYRIWNVKGPEGYILFCKGIPIDTTSLLAVKCDEWQTVLKAKVFTLKEAEKIVANKPPDFREQKKWRRVEKAYHILKTLEWEEK